MKGISSTKILLQLRSARPPAPISVFNDISFLDDEYIKGISCDEMSEILLLITASFIALDGNAVDSELDRITGLVMNRFYYYNNRVECPEFQHYLLKLKVVVDNM